MFQVSCSSDELSIDGTLNVRGLINNAKCEEPVQRLELSLIRVLKYRTDVNSIERIQKKKLLTKALKGVPKNFKDVAFVRNLDACLEEVFPIADTSNFSDLSLDQIAPFLQLVPTCVSQNFICYYQIEVRSLHGARQGDYPPFKLEFELFLDVSNKVLRFLEKRQ